MFALSAIPSGAWADCTVRPTSFIHSPGFKPGKLQTVVLNTAQYPKALCNDGTPGAYGIRRGFGAAASRWVIYLHGGGLCTDQTSCAPRYGNSKSSNAVYLGGAKVGLGDGIMSGISTHNPDFYDANAVAIAYCSSDLWTGGTDGDQSYPLDDVRSWHFRGRDIAIAVVQDLIAHQGLAPGSEVLIGGGSSGGTGVFEVINDLAPLLANMRVLAASDGGFGVSAPGYSRRYPPDGINTVDLPPLVTYLTAGAALWQGHGDSICSASARTPEDQQNCYSPPFLTQNGYIQTPMLLRQSQEDRDLLHNQGLLVQLDGSTTAPYGEQYKLYYANQVYNALTTVNPWHTVYTAVDTNHVMMTSTQFYTWSDTFQDGSGNSYTTLLDTAFGKWYQTPCPPTWNAQMPPVFTP